MKWAAVTALLCVSGCGTLTLTFPFDAGSDAGVDAGAADAGRDAGPASCGDAGPCGLGTVCDEEKSLCFECAEDADCGGATPVCDKDLRRCVPCVSSRGCAANQLCLANVCVTSCVTAANCAGSGNLCLDSKCTSCTDLTCGLGLECALGRCVVCDDDHECGGTTPHCETWTGRCLECVKADDCNGRPCVAGTCR